MLDRWTGRVAKMMVVSHVALSILSQEMSREELIARVWYGLAM